jgi:cobalt/nickel transport protein
MSKKKIIILSLVAAAVLALLISPFASSWPDGLEKAAANKGFLHKGEHSMLQSPIAGYLFPGVRNEAVATGLAGLLGVALVFGVGWGLQELLSRRK